MEPNQETVKNKEEGVLEDVTLNQEDDEYDSKERVLHKYFLQEWKLIKSLLDDTVSNGRVSNPSSVHKFRSIVLYPIPFYLFILFLFSAENFIAIHCQ